MTLHDRRGLSVSTSNRASLEHYERALDLTASYFVDPLVTAIEALGGRANERERMHAAAGRAWLGGDFFLGQSTLLRDRMAQVLPHWSDDVPGYGYVLGMSAFGLEETANYVGAEAKGRRALELNARDPLGRARRGSRHGDAGPAARRHRLADHPPGRLVRRQWACVPQLVAPRPLPPRSRRLRACRRAVRHLHPAGPVFGRAGDGGRLGNAVALDAARRGRRCPLAAAGRRMAAARNRKLLRVQRRACRHGAGGCRPLERGRRRVGGSRARGIRTGHQRDDVPRGRPPGRTGVRVVRPGPPTKRRSTTCCQCGRMRIASAAATPSATSCT